MKKLYNNKGFGEDNFIGIDLSQVVAFWLKRNTVKGYYSVDVDVGCSLVMLIRQALNDKPFETKFLYSINADYSHIDWANPEKNVVKTPETFYVGKEIYNDLVKYWSENK